MVKTSATFRGVAFKVSGGELTSGRRVVAHEYPFRDQPYTEDLGKRAKTFTVDAFVIGADFATARNLLLDALEAEGPGELVHPYYGTRRVAVTSVRVREQGNRSGVADFSIEFTETTAKPLAPIAVVDAPAKVATSVAASRTAVRAEFLAKYSPTNLANADSVSNMLRSATLTIDNNVATASLAPQALATLKTQAAAFAASVGSVVDSPEDLFSGLSGMIDLIESLPALLKLYAFSPGVRPPATTARRLQEQVNFDATQRVTQRLAALRAAELAPSQAFDNYDAAISLRESVTDMLDEQMETVEDDTFPTFVQLRANLVKAVPGESSNLPRLVAFVPPASVPSLVLAHRLYGDVDLEQDLLTRNSVRNPSFVRGGLTLEVITRG